MQGKTILGMAAAAATFGFAVTAMAADTIKVGVLHSLSGTMAISETTLKDTVLMLVEEHLSRHVLETIAAVGKFDETSGTGIAFQVDVEDAIGVRHQIQALEGTLEEII